MIIDFHTHVFPDKLAPKAVTKILGNIKEEYVPATDGTVASLLKNMDQWGIDVSVVQPVVTNPAHTRNTNLWARSICSDRILSFGGIHPATDDYRRDIDFIVSLGLKGLKFHTEFQNFELDDDKMLKVYDYAINKGLMILFHGGYDPGFEPPFKSSPKQFRNVVRSLGGGTIIAAHLGGHAQWDEVEQYLVGENIYLDTSMGQCYYSREQFVRIVRGHGAGKILFASDSPWSYADHEIASIRSSALNEDEKTAILGGNAAKLLGISG